MKSTPAAAAAAEEANSVDCCDLFRSPLCRVCQAIILVGVVLVMLAPTTAALLAWRALPDFDSSSVLPGLFTPSTGIRYQPGDDWSFECIKQRSEDATFPP